MSCSNARCHHRLATRDTLDSIVHQTCRKLEFYDVATTSSYFNTKFSRTMSLYKMSALTKSKTTTKSTITKTLATATMVNFAFCSHCCCGLFLSSQKLCIQTFFTILGPRAWTVIGDTFYALNSFQANFEDEGDWYYTSQCVEYSISAGKPTWHKSMFLGSTIEVSIISQCFQSCICCC